MTTRRRNGDPPDRVPAPRDSSRHHAAGQPHGNAPEPVREVIAPGVGLKPSGVRLFWAWVVARCPYCGGSHLHRGGPKGGLRRAGCGRGSYVVTATRKRGRRAA
jgi:hypothetical protein